MREEPTGVLAVIVLSGLKSWRDEVNSWSGAGLLRLVQSTLKLLGILS